MGIFSKDRHSKILLPLARAISNQPTTVECDFLEVAGITVDAAGVTFMQVRVASGSIKFREANTILSLREKQEVEQLEAGGFSPLHAKELHGK